MIGSIPIMQVRDNSLVVYSEALFGRTYVNNRAARQRMKAARKGLYSGKVTEGMRKRMVRAITLMCQAVKPKWIFNEVTGRYQYHRLSFITLTVSNSRNITAKQGYQLLLSHFLQWLRRTKGVKMYIWKAELQQRGQLHYHLTMPNFIHWREIRDKWNELQREAGLLDEYAEKHKHFDPNSTDVHETRSVKNMAGYLVKELTKSISARKHKAKKVVESLIQAGEIPADKKQQFIDEYTGDEMKTEGKLWDCSDNLSGSKYFSVELSSEHDRLLKHMLENNECRELVGDFWKVIYFTDAARGSPPDLLNERERKRFDDHLHSILHKGEKEIDQDEDPLAGIPAYCVADDVDIEQCYTWEQLQLQLN
jgi:hypothetical protein